VLVLKGSSTFLYSKEDVTQDDPLSMFMYVIGTLPLIHLLLDPGRWTQLWYADDASASETLLELCDWFNQLCSCGPSLATTLNLQRVLLLLMNNEQVKLQLSLEIWGFRW